MLLLCLVLIFFMRVEKDTKDTLSFDFNVVCTKTIWTQSLYCLIRYYLLLNRACPDGIVRDCGVIHSSSFQSGPISAAKSSCAFMQMMAITWYSRCLDSDLGSIRILQLMMAIIASIHLLSSGRRWLLLYCRKCNP